jgi:hypothetical protein
MYTSEYFNTAYKAFATDWVGGFLKEAFEDAKSYPDIKCFSKKIYAHEKIVNEILEKLRSMVDQTIAVSVESKKQKEGDICATFRIEWE